MAGTPTIGLSSKRAATGQRYIFDHQDVSGEPHHTPHHEVLKKLGTTSPVFDEVHLQLNTDGVEQSKAAYVQISSLDALQQHVADAFGWPSGSLLYWKPSSEGWVGDHCHPVLLSSDDILARTVLFWQLREERRRVDCLEAKLSVIQSAFTSTHPTMHYTACHMLWDVASKPHEHSQVTDYKLEQLTELLHSPELRVRGIAAMVLWVFAQQQHTLLRLPFQLAVSALVEQLYEEEASLIRSAHAQGLQHLTSYTSHLA